jgi:hypothetical protein
MPINQAIELMLQFVERARKAIDNNQSVKVYVHTGSIDSKGEESEWIQTKSDGSAVLTAIISVNPKLMKTEIVHER